MKESSWGKRGADPLRLENHPGVRKGFWNTHAEHEGRGISKSGFR